MRHIKFRAWDKEQKYWVEAVNIALHTSGNLIKLPPDIELTQYTGLKDKNGKEIYEGDIVKNVTYAFNGVVFFDKGCFWVRERSSNDDEGLWSIDLNWQIIGNIYEDPELVEVPTP